MEGKESSQQPYPQNYPPYEEDEINLLDMFIVLLKHKWMIFWVVFAAGVVAVVASLLMTNIYRSECTIAPIEQEKASLSSSLSAWADSAPWSRLRSASVGPDHWRNSR